MLQSNVPNNILQKSNNVKDSEQAILYKENIANEILEFFKLYKIESKFEGYENTCSTTRFNYSVPADINLKKLKSVEPNLKRFLQKNHAYIHTHVPNTSYICVELVKASRGKVTLGDFTPYLSNTEDLLPIALGKDVNNNNIIFDLAKAPHMLIAGTTGSGKSVVVNSIINSLLYNFSSSEVQFLMIDPKMVELSIYNDLPNLIHPVVTKVDEAVKVLEFACEEMDRRYVILKEAKTRNISTYNDNTTGKKMPFLVIVIDEYADLMLQAKKEIEESLSRLSSMSRAVGIHIILATQRPSSDVVTGVIKANFPTRIACSVASSVDSRVILGVSGAENLLGKGDMLFASPSFQSIVRMQSPFISEDEVKNVISYLIEKDNDCEKISLGTNKKREVKKATSKKYSQEQYDAAVYAMTKKGCYTSLHIQESIKVPLEVAKMILGDFLLEKV